MFSLCSIIKADIGSYGFGELFRILDFNVFVRTPIEYMVNGGKKYLHFRCLRRRFDTIIDRFCRVFGAMYLLVLLFLWFFLWLFAEIEIYRCHLFLVLSL